MPEPCAEPQCRPLVAYVQRLYDLLPLALNAIVPGNPGHNCEPDPIKTATVLVRRANGLREFQDPRTATSSHIKARRWVQSLIGPNQVFGFYVLKAQAALSRTLCRLQPWMPQGMIGLLRLKAKPPSIERLGYIDWDAASRLSKQRIVV